MIGNNSKRLGDRIEERAYRLRKKEGELENVAFSFARHGIFLEHGVGRGRKKGSASASKHKQPWLEPLLPSRIEALASILAEKYADIAAEELRIIIPGVFESKVKI